MNQSFMEKLLDGAQVEWKTLGEVAKILRGASPRPIAKFLTDDENSVPWIRIGDTSTSSKYVINTTQKITFEGAKNSRVLKKGDFIMSNSMSFGRPYILQIDGAIHDGWASISDFEDILYPDYLYYFLTSNSVQTYWTNKINSGSVSNLNLDIIKTLPIPIPSLHVQTEIVRILDAFTELTTELTARKKQYSYYRDQLLSFKEGEVEWKTLGETCDVYTGGEAPESS
ncbi:type I restriction modification DNA specificity domain protein [Leptospira borgpetersenii serovar Hardjo-bovis str. Sponselee]|uniref:Type I restriction modification DNA specificity domain protein n=1 Tax=Leptospira borgpetersenii serovar Hardjo-bovis str. Sponselee TaxID=1303729 RepID=M6C1W1_LEPBO|nr:type I restriction endonuclease subunit S [Leptospira borgpetersenii serovar Hardjo-bovis]AYR09712.1 type I restriction endonuclease subunit S [Leptospira borgpetersenii serovar Hardjo-bovis]EMJ80125.1 type I restriction modification DNA specificity domain protein [Leptospira borgpetersenii serovar Hardjo-bovis str. Sponselee]TQE50873.1 restriction endonuclease subunit S [Leptospira borgpetersenii]